MNLHFRFIAAVFFFFGFSHHQAHARQSSLYYIYFSDKGPGCDHQDLILDKALYEPYVDGVSIHVEEVRHQLKWLNALSVKATKEQASIISTYPFVRDVEEFGSQATQQRIASKKSAKLDTLHALCRDIMQMDSLSKYGLNGEGIKIAIFDAGFKYANIHPALAHLFNENRILATKNFCKPGSDVYEHSEHGTSVLSAVAGLYNSKPIGTAPKASYLLARIEHKRKEYPGEEDNWIAAAEWAVAQGANIISTSITYHYPRYTLEQMDGNSTAVSKAARIAAQKGILVISAMGNEGNRKWKYMGAPADVPEVLSVGGSMPMLPMYIKFASIGPNAKGHLKPDISAPAYVVSSDKKSKYDIHAGTSYAAPLIAGLAACIWQKYPHLTQKEIADSIRSIGHFFPYYDTYLGYGLPKAGNLFHRRVQEISPTFSVSIEPDTVHLQLNSPPEEETDRPNRVLYYHFLDPQGRLRLNHFTMIEPKQEKYFILKNPDSEGKLRIWFDGFLYEKDIEVGKK